MAATVDAGPERAITALPHGVLLYRGALPIEAQVHAMEAVFVHNDMFAKVAAAEAGRRYWQLLMWNWPNRCRESQ